MERMQPFIEKMISSNKNVFKDQLLAKYAGVFYSQCHLRDFKNYSGEDLANYVSSSYKFFFERLGSGPKFRLYNPNLKEDGFESSYTILDVVCDDAPFLLDSIMIQFERLGIEVKNIIHQIFSPKRLQDGTIRSLSDFDGGKNESVIQLHLSYISDSSQIEVIKNNLNKILKTVLIVVEDWKKILESAKECEKQIPEIDGHYFESREVKDFIKWIINDNFIFLGCSEFDIKKDGNNYSLVEIESSKLGLFKSEYPDVRPNVLNCSSDEIKDSVKNPYLIEILKSRYKSQIHRNANVERIRIQKFGRDGEVVGEYRFVGLFTSSVYYQSANSIPIIRKKITHIINASPIKEAGHSVKELISVLESYPRDELFQASHEDLFRISMGIVSISGRSLLRFFARNDKFGRFVSCLVFIPKDRFNTSLRTKIQDFLSKKYNGDVSDSYIQTTDSNLIRLQLIIKTDNGIPKIDHDQVEDEITMISRSWGDNLVDKINESFSGTDAENLIRLYENAFSVSYANRFDAKSAIFDIKKIDLCLKDGSIICDLYKTSNLPSEIAELKIYSPDRELLLSDIMPILDSFAFNVIHEHTYQICLSSGKKIWIHYFNLNLSLNEKIDLNESIKNNFEDTISRIWKNETKIGYLNSLVIAAGFNWRQVYMLRAYLKYLYQAGFRYDQKYLSRVLVKYKNITKLLIHLFEVKFNPDLNTGNKVRDIAKVSDQIKELLKTVSDAIDDTVIRRIFNVIDATLRTNFYQKNQDGHNKNYLSFKFDSKKIIELPLPVPYKEIFVYSTKVEGIHLRGGKVARGGIRWSDRHEDFRSEVLGLVKAQMTKNAVIVPVGSKGGFVIKENTSAMNRDQLLQTAVDCYKTFLRGLLDLTDNIVDGKIVHPSNVIRYDEDDPYLVVAADKGTASFSDFANAISAEYSFWLGDAFASGGSAGYDHKKMGITARGAWISVRRHFAEMGIDIQNQDFTCVGIGDLSGDVFGNGMILSRHTRLVAAFNHVHIFVDPNPDAETSFNERKRIFGLPRSNWTDYNKDLISKGGGVFERSAKSIVVSFEMKVALGIDDNSKEDELLELSPNDLILAILKAPVDLLWNGGIGTYVKSSDETNFDTHDRINDFVRVNGSDLRCKVVGEGGNLGFTQKGRIEYAFAGGRINTDAMDNSAGVDCSDHEVNIKIALISAIKAKKLTTEERNKILESMTDEVAELVLEDNRLQTQAITIAHQQGYMTLGDQAHFLNRIERNGLLNRKVEFLPDSKEINKRQSEKIGMTRPELCVMLAYSKMDLYNQILSSDLIKDDYFESYLLDYFPELMCKKFTKEILSHQLRSEIIATVLTNKIVNRSGITFVNQISNDYGFRITDIVRNYVIVCDSFKLKKIWSEIESLSGKVTIETQTKMFLDVNKLLERSVLWLLRNPQKMAISKVVEKYRVIVENLFNILEEIMAVASRESFERKVRLYSSSGAPIDLVKKIAAMDSLGSTYDIAEIDNNSELDLKVVGRIYFDVGNRLNLKWLRNLVLNIPVENYWQKLSAKSMLEDLYNYQMKIASRVVEFYHSNKHRYSNTPSLKNWLDANSLLVENYDEFISDLKLQINPDFAMIVVALNRIKFLLK